MAEPVRHAEQAVKEAAYFIWEREGRPEGRAWEHWERALHETSGTNGDEPLPDEEKILAGRPDVNMPALLTKDVLGG
jgi:hypothetical protein